MEITGLAVGIAGLAALFKTCMETIEQVDSYKKFGFESRYITTRFDADKLLFQRWADGVGLTDGKLKDVHHVNLDDVAIATVVARILSSIREIFNMTDTALSELRLQSADDITSPVDPSGFFKESFTSAKKRQASTSMKGKIGWALRGKAIFVTQVEVFGTLVDKLYSLVPPGTGDGKIGLDLIQLSEEHENSLKIDPKHSADWLAESQRSLYEMLDWLKVEKRKEIDHWLGATRTDQYYNECLTAQLPGTCDWIQCNPAYLKWVSADFPSETAKFLWIYGPPGHGKSVLCARLIQHLIDISGFPVVYFFFSSDVDIRGDSSAIIRSWVSQMVARDQVAFQLAFQRMQSKEGRSASRRDIWDLFGSIVSCIPECTFVVDGLDEYTRLGHDWRSGGNDNRKDFLKELKQSVAHTITRILIVSRDEGDIRSEVCSDAETPTEQSLYVCRICKDDIQSDIALFSKSIVDRKLPNKDQILRADLATQMAEKCNGMFLWIKMQQESLRGGKNRKQLQEAINDMPTGLEHIYDRTWTEISNLPSRDRHRALAILRWVTFALRPLTVLEMTDALIVMDDNEYEDLPIEELPDNVDNEYIDDQIIGLCGCLLEIRATSSDQSPSSRTVHLVHFSVKQYLLSVIPGTGLSTINDISFSEQALQANHLAKMCLRYINYKNAWECSSSTGDNVCGRPFLDYAARSWYLHVTPAGRNYHELVECINRVFQPDNPNWELWRKHFESVNKSPSFDSESSGQRPATALYYASLFGLFDTMEFLESKGAAKVNSIGGRYGTALQAACAKGHLPAVKFLIRCGADINVSGGEFGSGINAAAAMGHESIAKYLLDNGASLLLKDSAGGTPVYNASKNGHSEITAILLEKGADLTVANNNGWTPLNSAANNGHLEVVKVLLEKGAALTVANSDGWTPLNSAANNGHLEVVKVLLEKGADPAAANINRWTPLNSAANNGHLEVVKVLLEKGTDLTITNSSGWAPLGSAACNGYLEVVKLLLEKGADVTVANSDGWTPLGSAASNGHLEVVKVLLEKGADLTVVKSGGWNPLNLAASKGHLEIVEVLLEKGADVNVANSFGWTPVNLAANNGHTKVVEVLLEKGADLAAASDVGWTPLGSAACNGHLEVVKVLLEKGADFTVADSNGWTPLNLAASKGYLEMVEVLLEKGADVNVANNDGWTLVNLAANNGHTKVVEMLLEKGADLSAASDGGWTPLNSASSKGYLEIVKVLLEKGADFTVANSNGWTPLDLAANNGYSEVAKALLEKGADANSHNRHQETPLHHAVQRHHTECVKVLTAHGASMTAPDYYGRTALDWACIHQEPFFLEANLVYGNHQNSTEDFQRGCLASSIQKIADELKNSQYKDESTFYYFGHCLLFLNDLSSACVAFQQSVASDPSSEQHIYGRHCDMCSLDISSTWYVCKVCAETDLCQACMTKYEAGESLKWCVSHEFLRVPNDSQKPIDISGSPGFVVEEWVENVRSRYAP